MVNAVKVFTLLFILLSIAAAPGFGAEDPARNSVTAPQPFKLSAQASAKPQLSRQELDPAATSILAPVAAVKAKLPQLSYAPAPPQISPTPPHPKLEGAVAQDDAQRVMMQESNVDWSGWVSRLADRWYYILRFNEEATGWTFVTQRPALFQFTCFADGHIDNISLQQTSGNTVYDHLQVLALMQTAPLPAFPAGTKRNTITLVQGWESHVKRPGEDDYVPGSFGKNFPTEKVREWVTAP